ncbi:MAG TPA: protein kinase, partial [Gemmatimonadaceae bacterium]|nr:protein kinase [Gemmatimonadaceae bacterium]
MDALAQLKASLSSRYDIEREIGAGGMATVYLARDIRHDRPVALKLLNPELGAVLGVERFLAEIRVTANLQHPNLLPLFDSGEAEGLLYYVMPFVEGESLRNRLEREKQLPVDEAVRISVAIANALDYAHSHGVIHRDLKPENILLQSNQPVIADFGIALAVSKAGGNRITQTGLSLGTPQYMSPEQATGDRVIDGRSDIYSLGAVTYEMLTGEPPHIGSTSQAIIARVLTDKPRPMRSSRPAIPEHVEAAVMHALEKLPADRFSTAHEFAEAMQGRGAFTTTGLMPSAQRAAQRQSAWTDRLRDPVTLSLAALSVAAIAFAVMRGRQQAEPERVVRYVLATPDSLRPFDNFPWPAAISPDGSTIVYSVTTSAGSVLYSVKTDQLDPRLISGTEQVSQPVFSPDGQWVCFEAGGKLKKVRLDGSAPVAIADAGSDNGADWTVDDEIVLGSEGNAHGLSRVSADGGELSEFVRPDSAKGESDYVWPIALPDGKRVVFVIWSGNLATAQLATASIDGGEVTRLGIKSIRPLAVIGRVLVYVQADGLVMAVPLDRGGKKTDGRATPVLDPVPVVAGNNGNSGVFVSRGGALITSRGGARSTLAWIGKQGSEPISPDIRAFSAPRLSPDGKRIAAVVSSRDQSEIWIYDMETQTYSRLTNAKVARTPSWTPDGSRIVYIGLGGKDRFAIWSQAADGGSPAQKILDVSALSRDIAVAPDGKSLTYTIYNSNSWDIFRVDLDGTPKSIPYLTTAADEQGARISPDGKWVAVSSNESDRSEVYIRSYPDPSSRVQVSAGGGTLPVWSPDGSKVYYRNGPSLMQARLSQSPTLRVLGRDTVIANLAPYATSELGSPSYDIARDGRFVG